MKKKRRLFARKITSIICIVSLVLSFMPRLSLVVNAETSVEYIDRIWNGSEVTEETNSVTEYITISASTTSWGSAGTETWYVLSSDITISSRIEVSGNANVILSDGCTLTASEGIHVTGENSLTIYGQSIGNGSLVSTGADRDAGIGGNADEPCGTVTINGGIVDAKGATADYQHVGDNIYCGGAGIGSGSGHYYKDNDNNTVTVYVDSNGFITINGGTVTATGQSGGAGIGGGYYSHFGTITINGGDVTTTGSSAPSNSGSAGIGGGTYCGEGTIIINGGNIMSTGRSAGIGFGYWGTNTNITINGGTVEAKSSGYGCVGIGGTSCKLTINGGNVKGISSNQNSSPASGGKNYGSGIGGGNSNGSSTITLNWTSLDDRIYLSSIFGKTIKTAPGKYFANENDPYVPLTVNQINNLTDTTLVPVKTVVYREGAWNETKREVQFTNNEFFTNGSNNTLPYDDFTYIESDVTSWTDGIYVVNSNLNIDELIDVSGNVYLILADGYTLNAGKGIHVPKNSNLTIYGQTEGTGSLIASGSENQAGIGGGANENSGNVTIHGGNITAEGGGNASGIGGGNGGTGGEVTIYGGTITANGGTDASGIGGGNSGAGNSAIIYGGTVTANGNSEAAGIGGSAGCTGGAVSILGGEVSATGGTGVGNGVNGSGGAFSFTGGNLEATASDGSACFGIDADTITLTWTSVSDSIKSSSYSGTVAYVDENRRFANESDIYTGLASGDYADLIDSTIIPNIYITVTADYIDATCNETDKVVTTTSCTVERCISIEDFNLPYITELNEGWYIISDSVNMNTRIPVSGDVHLILADGKTLTATKGINVTGEGNSLTIYGQTEGTGVLTITTPGSHNSAIGGNDGESGGNVTIKGGVITATGGGSAAGIGGGRNANGGTLIIYNGIVTVTGGKYGAGIGSGLGNSSTHPSGGEVNIYGGNVTASGGSNSAGIGGSRYANGANVSISGGVVRATRITSSAYGIGQGSSGNDQGTLTLDWNDSVWDEDGNLILNEDGTPSMKINAKNYGPSVTFNKNFVIIDTEEYLTAATMSTANNKDVIPTRRVTPTVTVTISSNIGLGSTVTPVVTGSADDKPNYTYDNDFITLEYKQKDADDSEYSPDFPTELGNYVVRAKVPATPDYFSGTGTAEFAIVPHTHDFKYTVGTGENSDTITATCANRDGNCALENARITLKIIAPEKITYGDSNSASATLDGLTDFNDITMKTISEDDIIYYAAIKDGTAYTKDGGALQSAPVDAGDYIAEITVEEKTAFIGYTINKATTSIPVVSMSGYTYAGTVSGPSIPESYVGDGTPTFYYNSSNSNEGGTVWDGITNTSLDAGTYYMYAVISDGANYNGCTTGTTEFTVSPKPVTVSGITAEGKTYDGTTSVTLSGSNATINGIEDGDELTVTATGVFENANAGVNKTVNIQTIKLGGSSKDNYVLAALGQQTTATATIAQKSLSGAEVNLSTSSYVFDTSQKSVSVTSVKLENTVLSSNDFDVSGTLAATNVNTYTVTVTGKGNYKDTATADWTITNAQMTVNAANVNKVYDGSGYGIVVEVENPASDYSVTYGEQEGTYEQDDSPTLTDVGSKTVFYKVTAANYDDYTGSAKITITAKSVTITGVETANKVYDGGTSATVDVSSALIDGMVDGDDVSISAGAAVFTDKNVGEDKEVTFTGFSLTGEKSGNYTLSAQPASVKADITAKPVTIKGVQVSNKEYDGKTAATVDISAAQIDGMVDNDDVNISAGTAAFADKNVGKDKEVTFTDFVLTGDDANNYSLSAQPASVTAEITVKPVTITGVSAEDKVYDGTDKAEVNTESAQITEIVEGDIVSISAGTAAFVDKNAGEDKEVTFTGFGLTGDDAANYELSGQPSSAKADITPRSITDVKVTLDKTELTYNESEQTVNVTEVVTDNGISLTEDDYTVTGNTGKNRNDYTAIITGKGNFKDTASVGWSITAGTMEVTVNNVNVEYDDQKHGITVNVIKPGSGTVIKYGTEEGIYDLEESPAIIKVGSITVYFKVTDSYGNYNDFTGSADITISEADKTELNKTIKEAEDYLDSISDDDDYEDVADDLKEAIDKAKDFAKDPNVTAEEIAEKIKEILAELEDAKALVKAIDDENAAKLVEEEIEALKDDDDITLEDEEAVKAARDAYDKLTDYQKALISDEALKKLTDTEAMIKALKGKKYASYESDSEWTKGSDKVFKAGAKGSVRDEYTIEHFTGLKGDGKEIANKYYTAKKGSVKIELAPKYLETLEVGKHVLTLMFDDADDLNIEFTVLAAEDDIDDSKKTSDGDSKDESSKDTSTDEKAKDAKVDVDGSATNNDATTDKANEPKNDSAAKTGDKAQPLLAFLIMIDAALALNYVILRKRRGKRNN